MNSSKTAIFPQEADSATEFRFWIHKVVLPMICTFGIFGNVVTILLLTCRGVRTSTNVYLAALVVADLIYLSIVLWLALWYYP